VEVVKKENELVAIRIMAAGYLAACSPDGSDFERGQRAAMATALRWIENLQNSPVSDDQEKDGSQVGESKNGS
jgi:hypothetical protein